MDTPTESEVYNTLLTILDPGNNYIINPDTPLGGKPPPPGGCGRTTPASLRKLAGQINQRYPKQPAVKYPGKFDWGTVEGLAQTVSDFYAGTL
jgi:hypothetical protein